MTTTMELLQQEQQHYQSVLDLHQQAEQEEDEETEEEELLRAQEFHEICERLAANDPLLSKVESSEGGCIELRSDDEAVLLANSLRGNTHVEILALGLLGVTVRGAACLQSFLYSSPSLYCVCLDGSFMDGDTGIFPEEVSIVHVLMHAAMQNVNELNLYLSNCPVARSSLMAAVSSSSCIGQMGVTNCILVEDKKDYNPAIHMKNFEFSDTLYGITYGQEITPSRECELHGMMAMGKLLSRICANLATVELRIDLGDACCAGGFDWSLLMTNANSLSTVHYRMGEHESDDAFQKVLSQADGLEELNLELPSRFGYSNEKVSMLTESIVRNSSLTTVVLKIRQTTDSFEEPIICHVPHIEAHCANNRKFLEQWTDLRVDIPAHLFHVAASTAFKSQRGRLALSDRMMKQLVARQC